VLPPIPNHLPTLTANAPYRLAVLLPWPSEDDCRIGKPLTGSAGGWLRNNLSTVGIKLDAEVAICHVSQSYIATWEAGGWGEHAWPAIGWEESPIQRGIAQLAADLTVWHPNLVLGLDDPRLGAGVLHLLRHGNTAPHRTPSGYQWPSKLGKLRGSLFNSYPFRQGPPEFVDINVVEFKTLCTYSPVYLLSVWSKAFEVRQDLHRARNEARSPQLTLPTSNISYGPCE